MKMIHWKTQAKAVKRKVARRVHLAKLVHDCLPTHSRHNRIYTQTKHTCPPACRRDNATRDHIICWCPAGSRRKWRDNSLQKLEDFHRSEQITPHLQCLLRKALSQWLFLDEETDLVVSPVLFPINVRGPILQQNVIRWRQVCNGRLCDEWSRLQEGVSQGKTNSQQSGRC